MLHRQGGAEVCTYASHIAKKFEDVYPRNQQLIERGAITKTVVYSDSVRHKQGDIHTIEQI